MTHKGRKQELQILVPEGLLKSSNTQISFP